MVRVPVDAAARSVFMDWGATIFDGLDFGAVTERIVLEVEISGEPTDVA